MFSGAGLLRTWGRWQKCLLWRGEPLPHPRTEEEAAVPAEPPRLQPEAALLNSAEGDKRVGGVAERGCVRDARRSGREGGVNLFVHLRVCTPTNTRDQVGRKRYRAIVASDSSGSSKDAANNAPRKTP